MAGGKKKHLNQTFTFRFHVNFQGCDRGCPLFWRTPYELLEFPRGPKVVQNVQLKWWDKRKKTLRDEDSEKKTTGPAQIIATDLDFYGSPELPDLVILSKDVERVCSLSGTLRTLEWETFFQKQGN